MARTEAVEVGRKIMAGIQPRCPDPIGGVERAMANTKKAFYEAETPEDRRAQGWHVRTTRDIATQLGVDPQGHPDLFKWTDTGISKG